METVSSLPTPPLNSSNNQATTMDNSSANQDGTPSKAPARAQVSIEPMHMSPMHGGNPTDTVNMDCHALCTYLEQSHCSEETIHIVVTLNLFGVNWDSFLDLDATDHTLEQELLVTNKLTRLKLISESKNQSTVRKSTVSPNAIKQSASTRKAPTKDQTPYITNAKMKAPLLPTPKQGKVMVMLDAWQECSTHAHGLGASGG